MRWLTGNPHRLLLLDAAVIAWAVVWVGVAIAIGREVQSLSALADTVTRVGGAVEASGRALGEIGAAPVVGDSLSAPAESIEAAGASAVQSGRASADSVNDLSLLLGLSIAVIPALPLICLYIPLRLALGRERQTALALAREAGDDPRFRRFLARRSLESSPYHRLRRVTPEPWRAYVEGRYDELARAELERLGIERMPRGL
jgi:hypothetical protein